MPKTVALLRGINVGGKNKLAMKDLTRLFEQAGCEDVQTYIQSGNVIFQAALEVLETLPAVIAAAIQEEFSLKVPVVLRTAAQLEAVIENNPFPDAVSNEKMFHVLFLAHQPDPAAVASLDPARSQPDEFAVVGQDIYLHLCGSAADTKLTNQYFDSRLKTVSTARNWRTVNKLLELASS